MIRLFWGVYHCLWGAVRLSRWGWWFPLMSRYVSLRLLGRGPFDSGWGFFCFVKWKETGLVSSSDEEGAGMGRFCSAKVAFTVQAYQRKIGPHEQASKIIRAEASKTSTSRHSHAGTMNLKGTGLELLSKPMVNSVAYASHPIYYLIW